jgi:NAD(P)-dependent dehydrogenase (short-subunit alcohol dehydrogenase family)
LEYRKATAAVIGAGDFIGGAITKKFASEGFTVFAGRRHGDKLAPLVAEVEAAGGRIVGLSLDARKEEKITAFLQDADAAAPLEVCIFNVGANVNFPLLETTERVFRKVWEMACYAGFLAGREAARLMLRASSVRRTSTSPTWSSMPASIPHGCASGLKSGRAKRPSPISIRAG